MLPLTTEVDPVKMPLARTGECGLTEQEAELLEFRRSGGRAGERFESEVVLGLLGLGSALTILVFGWVVFKKVWFSWLGMPGWW
ncbi:MAG: hypothetical protein INR68_16890 [Methylobacterium mesophilicum]|nr:hypothetical protein [Methylobacterium mesophilicum]